MSVIVGLAQRAAWWGAGIIVAAALLFALLDVVATVAGAPPEHDVLPPNTTAVKVVVEARDQNSPTQHLIGPVAPTTSLATARCIAWQELNAGECPSAATLAQTYWPALIDQPQTIYVGLLWPDCVASPPHFNVEFYGGIGTGVLTLHCHTTGTWGSRNVGGNDISAVPFVQLVVVPTASMQFGQVYVYREDRVERWVEDDVRTTLLGVVTIH